MKGKKLQLRILYPARLSSRFDGEIRSFPDKQKLRELSTTKPALYNTREDSTLEHHQIVKTEIRLIIFFAAKDGEALYSQQKQDRELTVAQIMNSLLPNSDLT